MGDRPSIGVSISWFEMLSSQLAIAVVNRQGHKGGQASGRLKCQPMGRQPLSFHLEATGRQGPGKSVNQYRGWQMAH